MKRGNSHSRFINCSCRHNLGCQIYPQKISASTRTFHWRPHNDDRCHLGTILPPDKSTGSKWLDMVQFISMSFSSRAAKLGMIIMVIGGFSRYMDKIGASTALVKVSVRPLQKIGKPYLVLALTSILGNFLAMFISSASGFGLLLMVTMYPVLVKLGVSRLAAAAVIATTSAPGWGPAGADSIYTAELAGMNIVPYFINYQIPVGICTVIALAIGHYIVQLHFDKKSPDSLAGTDVTASIDEKQGSGLISPKVPGFYALLPTIPLFLVLIFGLCESNIKMDITLATLLALMITMAIEYLRLHNAKKLFHDVNAFWDGMGFQMTLVVTLVVAAETFSKGLLSLGAIDTLIKGAQGAGFDGIGMMFVFVSIIIAATLVTGSGNATFFAFASLAPKVALLSNVPAVLLLLPMNFVYNLARSLSPIAAVMIVVSGAAGLSPLALAIGVLSCQ